jgi:hypothetical protein
MTTNIEQSKWKSELTTFSKRNEQRPTRLQVMGSDREEESDYWLEDGLLFQGIDLDTHANRDVSLEIMLQGQLGKTRNHMTHNVASVRRINLERVGGRDKGLEIEDATGAVTILRFETRAPPY